MVSEFIGMETNCTLIKGKLIYHQSINFLLVVLKANFGKLNEDYLILLGWDIITVISVFSSFLETAKIGMM